MIDHPPRRAHRLIRFLPTALILALPLVGCASSTTSGGAEAAADPASAEAASMEAEAGAAETGEESRPESEEMTEAEARQADKEMRSQANILAPVKEGPESRPQGFPLEPPDGEWLIDDAGRRYFLHEVPKVEGAYRIIDGGQRLRLVRGLTLDIHSQDEEMVLVKIYGTSPVPAPLRAQGPTEAQLARAAGTYLPQAPTEERLSFAPIRQGLPESGQWRQGFDIADMDGDGRLEVVHGPARKGGGRLHRFEYAPGGEWTREEVPSLPGRSLDYGDVEVADLNGDGVDDLVVASHLKGLSVFVGDGQGSYSLWSEGIDFKDPGANEGLPIFSSRAVLVTDWNGDGRPDILASGEGPRLNISRIPGSTSSYEEGPRGAMVYLNQGDGTWEPVYQAGAGSFGDAIVQGDFDGDGQLDFATATASRGNQQILNMGDGSGSWTVEALPLLRPRAIVRALDAADFDGDGRDDLAVGYASLEHGVVRTGVDLLLSRPEGWQRQTLAAQEGYSEGIWSLAIGDLDGDGTHDVVAFTGEGDSWIFLGEKGQGSEVSFVRVPSEAVSTPTWGCVGFHVELVDLDGDGRDEIVTGFAGEGSELFGAEKCRGGGSLQAWKAAAR